jgi:hypothetical protein
MKMARISLVILVAALLSACSAITDFDMPPQDGALYSLDTNLPDAVIVSLGDDGTGSLALALAAPLPETDDATLLGYLTDGTIEIIVNNNATSVSFNLTDGTRVDSTPAAAGEYMLSLDAARTTLTVSFYNETMTGAALHAGGGYTASFSVIANDYFTTESFNRTATVE